MYRLLWILCAFAITRAAQPDPEQLIEAGHWKRARAVVEARLREAPDDALSHFFLSQIRNAFGDRKTPMPLAERAVALDGRVAKYHRQVAEVAGVTAQHAGAIQQLLLARRFRKEIDLALSLDPRDVQTLRDLLEFYVLAPGIAGGDPRKAEEIAARIDGLDAVEGLFAKARIAAFHKQVAEQEALMRKIADWHSTDYRVHIALAQFYLEREHSNLSSAEAQAKEALALDRGRADAYAILATIHADRGEWTELDAILGAALREVPDDRAPDYIAAERLLAAGHETSRAEHYLRAYLEQEPEGNRPAASQAHWKLGQSLEVQGRTRDAAAEFQESVRLDPESKAAQDLKRLRNVHAPNASNTMRPL